MADRLCRRAINQRVSGKAETWPLDYLYENFAPRRFTRMLSLGCGTGHLERAVRRLDISASVEGLDCSEASLEIARQTAIREGLDGIVYRCEDLNRVRLQHGVYDVVISHQSLHHVASIEKLLTRVAKALAPGGILFLEEWTGPSRFEWDEERLARPRALFAELPSEWRRWDVLRAPVEWNDPSEAIRSSVILPAVRRLFHVIAERPYGGHIVSLILPQLRRDRIPRERLEELLSRWLALEDDDLARDPALSYHTALVARPKEGLSFWASRSATLAMRVRLAMRYRIPALRRAVSRARRRKNRASLLGSN